MTKIDFVSNNEVLEKMKEYESFSDRYEAIIPISILKQTKHSDILNDVVKHLPVHPYLFDPEIMTTEHLRDLFKEFIRESIFENISDEIPYETDVLINKVEEKDNVDVIKATIIVQKSTQKGMIIGKGAEAIKRIGRDARVKIEKLTGKKCYLELFVSIKKGWTKDRQGLKDLGYDVTF